MSVIVNQKINQEIQVIHLDHSDFLPKPPDQNLKRVESIANMFRLRNENTSVIRPRRTGWVESYQASFSNHNPAFHIGDNLKIPNHSVTVPEERHSKPECKHFLKMIYDNAQEYCEKSTLHGLRYVGDRSISFGERVFWLAAVLCAVGFSGYFIHSIYAKFDRNPVIVTLSPQPTPISTIPFPAITICNVNQAKKSEVDVILKYGPEVDKLLLDDYCQSNSTFGNQSLSDTEAGKWENVIKFILKVNPSCQEMLKFCRFAEREMECDYLFNAGLTDEGLCCTFNQLPRQYIFRNPRSMNDMNFTFPKDIYDWTLEKGYPDDIPTNALPYRPPGAGASLGLTLILDADTNNYYCSSTSGVGFKVLLHSPIETPKMADYAFLVSVGTESRIAIYPKIQESVQTLRSIDVPKRDCYFTNERRLTFYRTYTQMNCKLECLSNHTLEKCGCVPYFLPKNKNIKICSKSQELCSDIVKGTLEVQQTDRTECGCLPGCFQIDFASVTSYSTLNTNFKTSEETIRNQTQNYTQQNIALLHFYFVDSQFTKSVKSELYGFSEFLSNTGGLLGLFMGFSFLSAVEIAYYLSLRVICSVARARKARQTQNRKERTVKTGFVHPFSK